MTTQLIHLNSLNLNAGGIWADADDVSEFDYSDGADEEQYLINTLKITDDISLDSAPLRKACRDWVAEYHLSPIRANLLKSINLPATAKVLEVGCGCGALTRYLGEQDGYCVDAVEGSATRAEISALRCRDLENVHIIKHNFNTLVLPQAHYDAVLFIGVLEYARRFIDDVNLTPEQAVVSLLNKAAASLSDSGVIIVAIENRTGLKYIQGAYEDHLAMPGVGINNYEGYEFTGIKTYDSNQWKALIDETGLKHRLFFPFGDYKFPNLVINGDVDKTDVAYLSNQIHSRDPISPWLFPAAENEQWANAISCGRLHRKSNSFGLVIAKGDGHLDAIFKHEWALFDRIELKPQFRINITEDTSKNIENSKLNHLIKHKLEYKNSLNSMWQASLSESPQLETIVRLASQLTTVIQQAWPQQKLVDFDQLFIADDQQHLDYVRYWHTDDNISAQQQLFHYLLEFCKSNQKLLSTWPALSYLSLSELIQHCLPAQSSTDELIQHEDRFRAMTQVNPGAVKEELAFIFSSHDKYQFRHINAQLFYSTEADLFAASQSIMLRVKQTLKVVSLIYEGINSTNIHLRFDPCDHEYGQGHLFCLYSIQITTPENIPIMNLCNSALSDCICGFHDLDLVDRSRLIFKVSGIDSQIKFSLPADLTTITDRYNLEIKLQWLGM